MSARAVCLIFSVLHSFVGRAFVSDWVSIYIVCRFCTALLRINIFRFAVADIQAARIACNQVARYRAFGAARNLHIVAQRVNQES